MDRGQGCERHRVLAGDRELMESVRFERVSDRRRIRNEVFATPRSFDRDLPQAGGAVEELVPAIAEEASNASRQLPGTVDVPQQQLRVHKEAAHFRLRAGPVAEAPVKSASISFSSIVLKSSGTGARAFRPPIRTGLRAPSMGTSRAAGRPALAMMISSPASTRSIRRERCVFASWMFTDFMDLTKSSPLGCQGQTLVGRRVAQRGGDPDDSRTTSSIGNS